MSLCHVTSEEDELIEDKKEAEEKVIVEEKKNGSFNATEGKGLLPHSLHPTLFAYF